jgi:hypothetical protein
MITRKFIRLQINSEALVVDIAIPITGRPDVNANSGQFSTTDDVGAPTIVRVHAVV